MTHVLDQQRILQASSLSANMLSQAKALCLGLLGPGYRDSLYGPALDPRVGHGYLDASLTHLNDTLIFENGDAELWMHLCSLSNAPPVHVLTPDSGGALSLSVNRFRTRATTSQSTRMPPERSWPRRVFRRTSRWETERAEWTPASRARTFGPGAFNDTTATPAQAGWIQTAALPICPPSVKQASHACATAQPGATCFGNDDANRWAVRGAINAGFSVFLYVQSLETSGPAPDYNQCTLLK